MLPASPSCPSASRPQPGGSTLTFRVYFWQGRAWVPVGHENVNVDDRLCAYHRAYHPFGRHVYRLFYHLLSRALWNPGSGPCPCRGRGLYLYLGLCGDRGLCRHCTLKR